MTQHTVPEGWRVVRNTQTHLFITSDSQNVLFRLTKRTSSLLPTHKPYLRLSKRTCSLLPTLKTCSPKGLPTQPHDRCSSQHGTASWATWLMVILKHAGSQSLDSRRLTRYPKRNYPRHYFLPRIKWREQLLANARGSRYGESSLFVDYPGYLIFLLPCEWVPPVHAARPISVINRDEEPLSTCRDWSKTFLSLNIGHDHS